MVQGKQLAKFIGMTEHTMSSWKKKKPLLLKAVRFYYLFKENNVETSLKALRDTINYANTLATQGKDTKDTLDHAKESIERILNDCNIREK